MNSWSRKVTLSTLAMLIVCGISGCNDENTKLNYDGIWVAKGYGEAIKVANNEFTHYQFTPSFCRISKVENLTKAQAKKEFWKVDAKQLRQKFTMHGIDFKTIPYDKELNLPTACHRPIPNDTASAKAGTFTEYKWFVELFDNYYPTFKERNINWQSLTAKNKELIKSDNDVDGLATAMVESIKPLKDAHVSISKGDLSAEFSNTENMKKFQLLNEYIAKNGSLDSTEKQAAALTYIQEQSQKIKNIKLSYANADGIKTAFKGGMQWYVTPDNVGVLIIDAMMGAPDEGSFATLVSKYINELSTVMPEVMKSIKNTKGLIIDIRENTGGIDGFSQHIAQYFLDKPRDLYKKQYRINDQRSAPEVYRLSPVKESYTKPIALLTSGTTVSAAEVFTLMLRDLPHVTVAGKTSQGAMSDILSATLPSGIEVSLVNEYYTSMAGELFEVTGIPVDVDLPYATEQQRLAGKDAAYEYFINKFKAI